MREFEFDLEEILERHPLPDGHEDRSLNMVQLMTALDVRSPDTIKKYVQRGMPVEHQGRSGEAWEFRLAHCHAWMCERRDVESARTEEVDRAALEYRNAHLDLFTAEELEENDPRKQAQIYEAARQFAQTSLIQGKLVSAADVQARIVKLFNIIRTKVLNQPDLLERKCQLSSQQVQIAADMQEELLRTIIEQASELQLFSKTDARRARQAAIPEKEAA